MSLVGRQRSVAAVHHQHQHSDSFIDSSTNKWLQNASLQDSSYRSSGTSQGSRFGRSFQGSDPSTPLLPPRSSSSRKKDDTSLSEFSPGLLDLQSFDTELLPEMPVPNQYDGSSLFHPARDKEKANHVAKIKVVVRKRPLNRKERAKREEDIITIESHSNSLTVNETKLKVDLTEYVEKHEFVFDAVLDEDVSNNEVYSETVESIVPLIFQRTKATCFAYGQTGSGKTYTMQPLPLKASNDILRLMHSAYRDHGFQLFVSFFEIYGGKVFDLLNDRRKLCMREDGKQQVCIVGLQEYRASNVEMIKELIERGNTTRSTGTTGANEESSRSHAILQLAIKKVIDDTESKPGRLVGKLSFIDLAGSERGADTTDNDKQTRMEGAEINKSLLALKECIRALDNDQVHIPFRGSKLTEVLRDSFVGNSRTVMISCISPSSGSCEHTINTLRYADRVKSLSKGSNLKKDPLPSSSSNAKDSTTPPLPSPFHAEPSIDTEHVPSGTAQRNRPPFLHPDYYKGQRSGPVDPAGDDWYYEKEKSSSMKSTKAESRFQDGRTAKPRDPLELIGTNSSRDLNLLLKEEEDLVNAHRRQVEESIDTVKEEMNLLVEADEAGNQLDDYLSKLSNILSRKAAGVLQLQNHLAHFQRRLSEYNVLLPSDR